MADVGVDERTLANFKALLDRLNRERPVAQQKTNTQIWQKLLQAVRMVGHAELTLKATDQLQAPTFVHPAVVTHSQANLMSMEPFACSASDGEPPSLTAH